MIIPVSTFSIKIFYNKLINKNGGLVDVQTINR